MTIINELTTAVPNGSDLLPIYSNANADARKISLTALVAYINANIPANAQVPQYASPSVNGSNITVAVQSRNTRLIISPTDDFASMTITLDDAPVDLETLTVTCTRPVDSLTFAGGTVRNPPLSFAQDGYFALQYDAISQQWYRVT